MPELGWYAARLRRMSAGEVLHRGQQVVVRRQRAARAGREPALRILTELPELPQIDEARTIRFFDQELAYTGETAIDWHRDYKSGIRAPRVFYGALDYRDAQRLGDVKYTWELNRHQFLVPWALDYSRTGDTQNTSAIVQVLVDWIAANPPFIGINWTSPLEMALRILSWGIVFDLCKESEHLRIIRPTVECSIVEQANYIRGSLSLHSSANNHLMGELVGLLAAGAFFPEAPGTRRHAEFAHGMLLEEAHRQNWPDGVNREQAIYYHHYTLEYLTTAMALSERLGFVFSPETRQLVHRMITFMSAMVNDAGLPFEIGDRDDGTVTGLNQQLPSVSAFESLLWSGAVLFHDSDLHHHAMRIAAARRADPQIDERTRYWHGDVVSAVSSASGDSRSAGCLFREGGYWIWRGSLEHDAGSVPARLLFKAGPFGYPSIAAHSHADQLSVLLEIDGQDVLTDSGTFCYHDQPEWRHYFRSTAAHNTIRVDEQDQALYAGPFLWGTHAEGSLQDPERGDDGSYRIAGVHTGYHRLKNRVDHSRTVELSSESAPRSIVIRDTLASNAAHEYDLTWNFGPSVSLEVVSRAAGDPSAPEFLTSATLQANLPGGPPSLQMTITSDHPFRLHLSHGNVAPPAGWYSRQFGTRVPIYQVRASVKAGWWGVATQLQLA